MLGRWINQQSHTKCIITSSVFLSPDYTHKTGIWIHSAVWLSNVPSEPKHTKLCSSSSACPTVLFFPTSGLSFCTADSLWCACSSYNKSVDLESELWAALHVICRLWMSFIHCLLLLLLQVVLAWGVIERIHLAGETLKSCEAKILDQNIELNNVYGKTQIRSMHLVSGNSQLCTHSLIINSHSLEIQALQWGASDPHCFLNHHYYHNTVYTVQHVL